MIFREYELIYILSPEADEMRVSALATKVEDLIKKGHGGIIRHRDMGAKKLAYEIDKQQKGIYTYLNFYGTGSLPGEIENMLKYEGDVLRYLTVKIGDDIDPEKRLEEAKSLEKEEEIEIEGEDGEERTSKGTGPGQEEKKGHGEEVNERKPPKEEGASEGGGGEPPLRSMK